MAAKTTKAAPKTTKVKVEKVEQLTEEIQSEEVLNEDILVPEEPANILPETEEKEIEAIVPEELPNTLPEESEKVELEKTTDPVSEVGNDTLYVVKNRTRYELRRRLSNGHEKVLLTSTKERCEAVKAHKSR